MDSDEYNDLTKDREKINLQADHKELSMLLSCALNRIGFSEEHRMAMSGTSCIRETLRQINTTLLNRMHCILNVGSLAEGTTKFSTSSDRDVLLLMPTIFVYKNMQNRAYCQSDKQLIILNDPITPPGYTKLQMVKIDINKKSQHFRQKDINFLYEVTTDLVGRSVLSNILLKTTDFNNDERNGPAETVLHKESDVISTDFVRAYYCDFIPDIARPWFHRIYSNWPFINIRDKLSKLGCFVVPVGCPISAEKELEWRFSFSVQEKYIMLNLNPTQYKCYIMLKLIKKYILEPHVGKCITSYHCKTVLFYTIENSVISIWNENNLINCVMRCLQLMKIFVSLAFCPNYFIPEENMFIGKLTVDNQHLLNDNFKILINNSVVITQMIEQVAKDFALRRISDIPQLASNIHTDLERVSARSSYDPDLSSDIFLYGKIPLSLLDDVGLNVYDICKKKKLYVLGKHMILPELNNAIEYINVVRAFLECETQSEKYLVVPLILRYLFFSIQCPPDIDASHWSKLALSSKPFLNTDYEKKLILQAYALASNQIHTEIESLQSSISLTYELRNLQFEMMISYDKGNRVNYFTNCLKLTTFYYKQKQYGKCIHVFKQLFTEQYATCFKCACSKIKHYERCYNVVIPPNGSIKTILSIVTDELCGCVKFDMFELETVISPLIYEAFRSFATPEGSRIDMDDFWFDWVVVDPVIYLNFMQLKCAYKMGYRLDDAKALSDIEQTIVSHLPKRDLAHLDTALNILGRCYLCKGWSRLALQCYKVSWTIRPLHNAAKWHVVFLMFGNRYK